MLVLNGLVQIWLEFNIFNSLIFLFYWLVGGKISENKSLKWQSHCSQLLYCTFQFYTWTNQKYIFFHWNFRNYFFHYVLGDAISGIKYWNWRQVEFFVSQLVRFTIPWMKTVMVMDNHPVELCIRCHHFFLNVILQNQPFSQKLNIHIERLIVSYSTIIDRKVF